MTHTLQPACGLVLVFDNDVTCPCVRVVKQLSHRVDGCAGHADGCKRVVPVRGRMLRKCGLDMIEVSLRCATRSAFVLNRRSSTIASNPATEQNFRHRLSLATPIMIGPSAASKA